MIFPLSASILRKKKMYDIIIVGGGPSGLTAALYALRANKKVLIIEKSAFGGQMTYSPKIENYPGYDAISGSELADKMLDSVLSKGAEVELDEVLKIEDGDTKKVIAAYGEYEAKAVIIANGVKHRHLGLENEDEFTGNGIYYCAVCDGGYFKNKNVILIGGGNSALQEAALLSDVCANVTVVQNLADFTGEAGLSSVIRNKPNVKCIFNTACKSIISDGAYKGVRVLNTVTAEESDLYADGMFVAIGLEADNKAFADITQLNEYGYFDSDETCFTKTPGIFVAGDCRSKKTRQIVTASGDGASASLAACEYCNKYDFEHTK